MAGTLHVLGADVYEMFVSINEAFPTVVVIEDSHKP